MAFGVESTEAELKRAGRAGISSSRPWTLRFFVLRPQSGLTIWGVDVLAKRAILFYARDREPFYRLESEDTGGKDLSSPPQARRQTPSTFKHIKGGNQSDAPPLSEAHRQTPGIFQNNQGREPEIEGRLFHGSCRRDVQLLHQPHLLRRVLASAGPAPQDPNQGARSRQVIV